MPSNFDRSRVALVVLGRLFVVNKSSFVCTGTASGTRKPQNLIWTKHKSVSNRLEAFVVDVKTQDTVIGETSTVFGDIETARHLAVGEGTSHQDHGVGAGG